MQLSALSDIAHFFTYGLRGITAVDVLDILVVATLIYAVFVFLKRTQTYFILAGIIVLFFVYISARFFNLYLTNLVFKSFFTSFIIISVIIFQRELRKFFEWVSMARIFSRRREVASTNTISDIVEVVSRLSLKKIGALIVFSGRDEEEFERVIDGGIGLDGKISTPLIESIFDPTSPGHDGAMVIRGDKVQKFCVHLPLAEKFKDFKNLGTRHRAALGLAQQTDAFVIAVSEERGTISVAYRGELTALSGARELSERLEEFFLVVAGTLPLRGEFWYAWIFRNFHFKLLALICAMALWFMFVFQLGVITREVSVPVEFRFLSPQLTIDKLEPREVKVTLSGRERDFNLLKPGDLKISITLPDAASSWQRKVLTKDSIIRPFTISVISFSPKAIEFHIAKVVQ